MFDRKEDLVNRMLNIARKISNINIDTKDDGKNTPLNNKLLAKVKVSEVDREIGATIPINNFDHAEEFNSLFSSAESTIQADINNQKSQQFISAAKLLSSNFVDNVFSANLITTSAKNFLHSITSTKQFISLEEAVNYTTPEFLNRFGLDNKTLMMAVLAQTAYFTEDNDLLEMLVNNFDMADVNSVLKWLSDDNNQITTGDIRNALDAADFGNKLDPDALYNHYLNIGDIGIGIILPKIFTAYDVDPDEFKTSFGNINIENLGAAVSTITGIDENEIDWSLVWDAAGKSTNLTGTEIFGLLNIFQANYDVLGPEGMAILGSLAESGLTKYLPGIMNKSAIDGKDNSVVMDKILNGPLGAMINSSLIQFGELFTNMPSSVTSLLNFSSDQILALAEGMSGLLNGEDLDFDDLGDSMLLML